MGCLMAKTQHIKELRDQIEMMENTIVQLRADNRAMKSINMQLQFEHMEMKNKVVQFKSFNAEIIIWSSRIRCHNSFLSKKLDQLRKWQTDKALLKERFVKFYMSK